VFQDTVGNLVPDLSKKSLVHPVPVKLQHINLLHFLRIIPIQPNKPITANVT